jgi:hypothetical protein
MVTQDIYSLSYQIRIPRKKGEKENGKENQNTPPIRNVPLL